jgi:hypothetical protein
MKLEYRTDDYDTFEEFDDPQPGTLDEAEDRLLDMLPTLTKNYETGWLHPEVRSVFETGDSDPENLYIDGEETDRSALATYYVGPTEPKCCSDNGDHDWQAPQNLVGGCDQNPGVFGHGGGVLIYEVCMNCGTEKVTDNWAQDPSNGEQGLDEITYVVGKYADEVEKMKNSNES